MTSVTIRRNQAAGQKERVAARAAATAAIRGTSFHPFGLADEMKAGGEAMVDTRREILLELTSGTSQP